MQARIAFKVSAQALRVYWHHRLKTGYQPMSLDLYRLRFDPMLARIPDRNSQRRVA